jgi:putative FmdB family regulatory protein
MPIYEYRCDRCSGEFEVIQKFSDPPLRSCAKCGGKLEKLLSRSGFSLKGAGWYADGYGGKPAGAAARPAKAGSSETPAGGSKPSSSD